MKKDNLKICFVQPSVYPLFNKKNKRTFGGAEVQVYQIGNYIADNYGGISVFYLVGNFGQEKIEIYNSVRIYRGANFLKDRSKFIQLREILKLLSSLKEINADVYVQRSATAGTGLIAFFCKLFNKKFIYMASHEIDVSGEFKRKNKLAGYFYEWGLKNANLVVSQSEEQKKLLMKNYDKKSIVINSVYKIEKNIDVKNKKYVLWVGRCEKWKAPEKYIQLTENNQEIKFIMIMPKSNNEFYDDYFKNIQKKASKIKNLIFIEKVIFDEIDDYFKKAKIFINTSNYEGFPNTFIQAAKNKTPIISFNVNPNNFLDKYKCGFCIGNLKKIEEKLIELWNNKELREKLGENAYKYAKDNHDIKRNTKIFIDAIYNLT